MPTNPAIAIGFVLAGTALWCLRESSDKGLNRRLGRWSGGVLALLGLAALIEFSLVAAQGTTYMLERENAAYLTAPATALSFVLLGTAFAFLDVQTKSGRWPAQRLVLTAAAINLLAAAGYYYGPADLHQIAAFTAKTLPSVLLSLLLCAAMLAARPGRGFAATFTSDNLGGVLMRRLIPPAIAVPLLVGWVRLLGEEMGLYHVGFGSALFATLLIILFIALIWWSADKLGHIDEKREQATQELRAANERLQSDMAFFRGVADTVPGILFTWKPDGANTFACQNFYDMTGIPPESAQNDGWAHAIHPDDREEFLSAWYTSLETGEPLEREHRLKLRDGSYHWAVTRTRAIRNDDGELVQWVGISADIQEQKRVAQNLETLVAQRTRELKTRNEQLTRLASELTATEQRERRRLARILHDNLQQLLVGAKFSLNVLSRKLPEEQKQASREVEDLLDESIAVSRSLTVELSPPILHEAGLAAGMEWLARWMKEKRDVTVELDIDPGLTVERDDIRVLLFETIRELLLNVAKHAGVDRAYVAVKEQEDGSLQARIVDKGVGFEATGLPGAEKPLSGGFGLFNVKERLGLAGGRIEIQSTSESGSQVVITLPVDGALQIPTEDEPPAPHVETPAADDEEDVTASRESEKIRLLIVDDHAIVRRGLAAMLTREPDVEIVGEAENGKEAIEQTRKLHPDVVLMDFSMPMMDGVQATRAIRKEFPGACVIGLSMFEEQDRAKAMTDAGASTYVSKSEPSDKLLPVIRDTLANKNRAA